MALPLKTERFCTYFIPISTFLSSVDEAWTIILKPVIDAPLFGMERLQLFAVHSVGVWAVSLY